MANAPNPISADRAIKNLLEALAIPGITGEEKVVGEWTIDRLRRAGIPARYIRRDQAHRRIPLPTQAGNVIARLPGTVPGPRRMLMAHLDTVPLAAGAQPVLRGKRIVNKARTALGGDDRAGVASVLSAVEAILRHDLPHPPLTVLFTIREESGLYGARYVRKADLGHPAMAFSVDGLSPAELAIAAVGADRWEADLFGIASHAGVAPEKGVSAIAMAAAALDEVRRGGWMGRVRKGGRRGTSNVGAIRGGDATNVVTDRVFLKGESRSHDERFIDRISAAYDRAFAHAARVIRTSDGRRGSVAFRCERQYRPFKLAADNVAVKTCLSAARTLGFKPCLRAINGGLDANFTNRAGIPTVTLGAGERDVHTVDEWVDVADYLNACRYLVTLATCALPKG